MYFGVIYVVILLRFIVKCDIPNSLYGSRIRYPEEYSGCTFEETDGDCVNIMQCKVVYDLHAVKPPREQFWDFLRRATCGYEGNIPKVCCVISRSTAKLLKERFYHQGKTQLLPEKCGEFDEERITGGKETYLFEYPWMVLLAYQSSKGLTYKCAGTLISSRYVLTAAHCTRMHGNIVEAVLGEHDLRTDPDCQTSYGVTECAKIKKFGIERVVPHEEFTFETLQNDIALIRLAKEVPIDRYPNIVPVCLPIGPRQDLNGTILTAAGWGDKLSSPVLLKVSLPVLDTDVCEKAYKKRLDDRVLCAGGESGKDTCYGDSGGPVTYPGPIGGTLKIIQQGIISSGLGLCGSGQPGLLTRVATYIDWILENLEP